MHWTKSKGTGGRIGSEEDFIVEEIPSRKYFSRFRRSGSGVKTVEGPYTLGVLWKKGMTTRGALDAVGKELNLKRDDIGYAGLKDKFAVTSQYITVKGNISEICKENHKLSVAGRTDRMMQVGDLEGNRFAITLRSCRSPKNITAFVKEISSRGMPNYFGPQRFGMHGNNHIIGKLLLNDRKEAMKLIDRNGGNTEKRTLKFYIHAYQSYLFNRLLDKYISLNTKPFFGEFPIAGFDAKLKGNFAGKEMKKIMKEEAVRTEDFSVRELGIMCTGSSRAAFVMPKEINYKIDGKTVELRFVLPKGSYATVLIGELSKNKIPKRACQSSP